VLKSFSMTSSNTQPPKYSVHWSRTKEGTSRTQPSELCPLALKTTIANTNPALSQRSPKRNSGRYEVP
jgi:hypothetical protein